MTDNTRPYQKLHHLGSRKTANVFEGSDIDVQEKIDGSQFRFFYDTDADRPRFFSRYAEIDVAKPDKLFAPTVAHLMSVPFDHTYAGLTFYGEAMCGKRHHKLTYDRVPDGHLVLFDVILGDRAARSGDIVSWARRLGVEPVERLLYGSVTPLHLDDLLKTPSMLGGMLEGVVIKNRANGVMAKYVAPAFREIVGVKPRPNKFGEWPAFITALTEAVSNPARWEKALAHLRESGSLTDSAKDIGPIVREVQRDILEECESFIKDELYQKASPIIVRESARPIAPWYKDRLTKEVTDQISQPAPSEEIPVRLADDGEQY